ncbi:MAG: nucleotidyl transferase AbiEii/AbiGii toxin family protein, partial [Lachnospiraceae bacterium]|nr:nucleotidyl transferase AbiEii/AbiGii toxin family protein [Lachnospiraceae bacterium]
TIMDGDIIPVKAYNKETIIAEKYETIIRRNIANTRARDYYDLYKFYSLYKDEINIPLLKLAVERTSKKRESEGIMAEWQEICEDMINDSALRNLWSNYSKTNAYAANISYEEIMKTVEDLAKQINSQ